MTQNRYYKNQPQEHTWFNKETKIWCKQIDCLQKRKNNGIVLEGKKNCDIVKYQS